MTVAFIQPSREVMDAKRRLLETVEDVQADVFDPSGGFLLSSPDGGIMIVLTLPSGGNPGGVVLSASLPFNDNRGLDDLDKFVREFRGLVTGTQP